MRSFIIIWLAGWLLFLRILCNHRFHFDIPYKWFSSVWQKVISLSLSCPWTYLHVLGLLTWTCRGFEILWKPNCCLVVYLHILKFLFSSEHSEIAIKHSVLELSMVAEVKKNPIWGALGVVFMQRRVVTNKDFNYRFICWLFSWVNNLSCENAHHIFPVTSFSFFCSTNSSEPKDSSFTVIRHKEKMQNVTFKEPENIWYICSKNYLSDLWILKTGNFFSNRSSFSTWSLQASSQFEGPGTWKRILSFFKNLMSRSNTKMEIRWVVWGTDCAHKAAVNYQKWPRNLGTKHICAHGETEQVDFSVPEKIFAVIELQKLERLNTSHHAGIDLAQSLSSVHCNWIWRGQKKNWGRHSRATRQGLWRRLFTNVMFFSGRKCLIVTFEMFKLQFSWLNALSPYGSQCDHSVQKQYLSTDSIND